MNDTAARNSIRSWALVAVFVSSIFTIGIAAWITSILSDPEWCNRILGASKYIDGRPDYAVAACRDLMMQNADTLGTALIIAIGVQAGALLVLVVIVLAGGRLSFKASNKGVSANMSREVEAAREVADAADDAADQIAGDERCSNGSR